MAPRHSEPAALDLLAELLAPWPARDVEIVDAIAQRAVHRLADAAWVDLASGMGEPSCATRTSGGIPPAALRGDPETHARTVASVLADQQPRREPARLHVPLAVGARCLGVLTLARAPGEPDFDDAAHTLATAFGRYAALALEAARLRSATGSADPSGRNAELQRVAERATEIFAAALDYDTTLAQVVQLPLPALADFAVLSIVGADGRLRRVAMAHVDPTIGERASTFERGVPEGVIPRSIQTALELGEPLLIPEIDARVLDIVACGPRHRAMLEAMHLGSGLTLPLVARGKLIGAMVLATSGSARRFTSADLPAARGFAAWCALAIDNARLLAEAQEAARRREESRAVLDAVVRAAPVGMAFFDSELRYVFANEALARLDGRPVEGHAGRLVSELIPDLWPTVGPILERVLATGEPVLNLELQHAWPVAPDERRAAIASFFPAKRPDGSVLGVGTVVTDITAMKHAEEERERLLEAVTHQQRQLIAILRHLPVGVVIAEAPSGRILLGNPRIEEMVGHPVIESANIAAYTEWALLHADGRPMAPEDTPIARAIRTGETTPEIEIAVRHPDGTLRCGLARAAPIRDREDRLTHAVLTVHDVTDRKRAEQERAELLAREQAANRAKDVFLATVSHELRTPIDPVLSWIQLLRTGALDVATVAHGLETIEQNIRRLAGLIDELLDVGRITAGTLRLDPRPSGLASIVSAAIETMRPAAAAKGIELRTALDEDLRGIVDPGRLQQVVVNLLANAVRFTDRGGRIDVGLTRRDASAEITVTDTGQGIAAGDLARIFEHFVQGVDAATDTHRGLGLGLAITRHLVELHGGTVEATSGGRGRGATFVVRLPLPASAAAERDLPRATSAHEPGTDCLRGVRILLVEDSTDGREVLGLLLGRYGAEVTLAGSAADALAALEGARPDVVVSDIRMPDVDGLTLVRRIRARPGDRVPTVALTACASAREKRACLAAGFDAHLAKPADPAELVALLHRLAPLGVAKRTGSPRGSHPRAAGRRATRRR
ncbi:MAG: ATP-binding protein [Candidatus Binatia bacterium]